MRRDELDSRAPSSTDNLTRASASARRSALSSEVLLRSAVVVGRHTSAGGRIMRAMGSAGTVMRSIEPGDLGSVRLLLLLRTLGLHPRVLENVAEGCLDLADERLGSTARGLGGGVRTSTSSPGTSVSTTSGVVDRVIPGVSAGVSAGTGWVRSGVITSRRVVRIGYTVTGKRIMGVVRVGSGGVDTSVIASRGVMGVSDAVTGQGVVRVMGVVARETSAGGTSGAVAGSVLLVSAKLAVIGAAGDRVSPQRRVGASLVPSQRVVGVRSAVPSERVVRVVRVGTGGIGGIGAGMVAGRGVMSVGDAVARERVMRVVLGTSRGVGVIVGNVRRHIG